MNTGLMREKRELEKAHLTDRASSLDVNTEILHILPSLIAHNHANHSLK